MINKFHFKLFCLLLIACHTSREVSAQPYFDVVNVHYINSPKKNPVSNETNPSAIRYSSAQVGVPVRLNKDILVLNPFFESYALNFGNQAGSAGSISLYSVGFPVTFLKQWKNEKWKTAFVFIPRLNADFKNINAADYQFGGAVLAVYRKKENLAYKFGLYYNSEFFGPFFIPLFGIDWNINERLNLFGVLPGNLALEYKINAVLYGGINFKSITNSYRFGGSSYLKVSDNYLKLFLDYYPVKNIAITAEAGHSILRKYKISMANDVLTLLPIKDGMLLKAGLSYRIRLTGKK